MTNDSPHFNGPEYKTDSDHKRLETQYGRIKYAMSDGKWRTLTEISTITKDPAASISAQLRQKQPELANTLTEIRDHGHDGFLIKTRELGDLITAFRCALHARQKESRIRVIPSANAASE